ncbi:hypothetical protein LOTGIDRAFT_233310 [Lottia gigantea]|uniref:Glycosyltransferase 61 catalytic domain-containing protein n=1 Tax=Lottia gigantea TaxID=225164 RepID=V4BSP6_LOTGI|nr:hypothetical protein LOTGIDRAFT_233310 [Lottia gigantea]ESO92054.1 hypothetical protein LOTGIDRAFT_233310 [Lottia gigantea]
MRLPVLKYRLLFYAFGIIAFIAINKIINASNREVTRTERFLSKNWATENCVTEWSKQIKICNGEFAILNNVLLEPFNSDRTDPNPDPKFTIKCDSLPDVKFQRENHLNKWYDNIICTPNDVVQTKIPVENHLTIMVRRYEYANLYHTMTDFYNVFILIKELGASFNDTNILLWDYHPSGLLDDTWLVLFNRVYSIEDVRPKKVLKKLVWGIIGYNSPMSAFHLPRIPLVEDFSEFFLSRYEIRPKLKLSCERLNILFIWRHDYVAHPNNPSGLIQRKILNEQEILRAVQKSNPRHSVEGVQLDVLPMRKQLQLIAHTDILVGMHGAGLTNTLFLPKHAGLIELFPYVVFQSKWVGAYLHFESIARWRKLKYIPWRNPDKDNQYQQYNTKIHPDVVTDLVSQMKAQIC